MRRLLLTLAVVLTLTSTTDGWAAAEPLKAFGRGTWQNIRITHAGQALVVHFWGVTCGPCRTEMPEWGTFLAAHPGLHLVMIDADLVPNDPGAVKTMLARSGLSSAESWMFADAFVERLRYEIDPRWHGEIPLTMLIAPDGTVTTLEGVADFAQIDAWLERQTRR